MNKTANVGYIIFGIIIALFLFFILVPFLTSESNRFVVNNKNTNYSDFESIKTYSEDLNRENYLNYVNDDYGFNIEYPNNWEKRTNSKYDVESAKILVFFMSPYETSSDKFQDNINFGIVDFGQKLTYEGVIGAKE